MSPRRRTVRGEVGQGEAAAHPTSSTCGRIQTTPGPGSVTAPTTHRQSTASRYPPDQELAGGSLCTPSAGPWAGGSVSCTGPSSEAGNSHAVARAQARPLSSSYAVASHICTVRPGRTTDASTRSGPTGTGPSSSIVSRPTTRSASSASTARASSAAGGPPCWVPGPQGPAVEGEEA